MFVLTVILVFILTYSENNLVCALDEDELCMVSDNEIGTCTSFYSCPEAIQSIKAGNKPVLCGFDRFTPIVCCRRKRGVIEEATIKSEVKQSPGCIGYNNLASSIDRDTLEFPHMAILGYGIKDSIEWRCTGALISEKHVLTSATCANTELGQIQYVNLGEPKSVQTFMVKTIHFHPERSIYSYYHDIALIELDGNVNLNGPIKPACLQTQKSLPEGHPKVSNWKLFNYTNKWLDTIEMIYVPFEDCKDAHKPQAYLEGGVRDDWQICAVGKNRGADTCKSQSGAPLQIKLNDQSPYIIVGVASFLRGCISEPGIYTRVSYYVSWIQNITRQN